ncbi:MAG TPA: hypothetical protein VES20_12170 [Bryobacteraceae bacterium]|nr:hypothetical protein [Bryobacteraceae bacterium]
MTHRLERNGVAAEYPVPYYIGSGHVGRSYLITLGGRLFQSPLSYYSHQKRWDMSPGYERELAPDFDRPVGADCLFCHGGSVRAEPPLSAQRITCQRCHGDASRHLGAPSRSNIVNPVRLEPARRDSVCEQCHLSGEIRILHPGKAWDDFKPGMLTEEVFSTFVRAEAAGAGPVKVVSHVEQMHESKCFRRSAGRMWCGTCHDPHGASEDPRVAYRSACLGCHSDSTLVRHGAPKDDCIGCHMPKRAAMDVPHTAFTNHRIPRTREAPEKAAGTEALRPWREVADAFAQRGVGLAYIGLGDRDASVDLLQQGFRILTAVEARFADDPDVLSAIGLVLLRKQVPEQAFARFSRVVALRPSDASAWLNQGIALYQTRKVPAAINSLEKSISLDPSPAGPYRLLAEIHRTSGNHALAQRTIERYMSFMPQHLDLRHSRRRTHIP